MAEVPPVQIEPAAGGRVGGVSRLTLYPIAFVIAIAIGVVLSAALASNSDDRGDGFGGDYPAFFGAGKIAAEGDWDNLYDLGRQVEAQDGLHPSSEGAVARFFAYPPQVAFLYQPLAGFNYYWSYVVHTMLMGILLWASLMLARPMIPWLSGRVALGMAAAIAFWPMLRTITGGSNTALTLFLLVSAWRLVHEDRQVAAGTVLALLLFKPQFAVPMIGLFLLGRYWRVIVGATVGAVAFYASGVLLRGWNWVAEWADVATEFGTLDAEVNGHSSISFIGFAENLFGVGYSAPVLVAWLLAGATSVFLSLLWWRSPKSALPSLMAVAMPGVLLLSVHAMSHDGAVVVLTAAVAAALWPLKRWLPWVVVVWLLGGTQAFIAQLGFSPGFPMLLVVFSWGYLLVATSREVTSADELERLDAFRQ